MRTHVEHDVHIILSNHHNLIAKEVRRFALGELPVHAVVVSSNYQLNGMRLRREPAIEARLCVPIFLSAPTVQAEITAMQQDVCWRKARV
eukprot:scaffold662_cov248-Pinguiococcus_pyrenoidosus.AAC.5